MKKRKLEITKEVEEHIEAYYNLDEAFEYYKGLLVEDVYYYLSLVTEDEEEIEQAISAINTYDDAIKLIEYITNGEEKNIKDVVRQAYVISNEPIPYERKILDVKCGLTKEQIKELEDLNVPYSVKELEDMVKKYRDIDRQIDMSLVDYKYLNKLAKKTKDARVKKILKAFENEYLQSVPKKEVKEIHVYFPDYDEDLLFLDEEGLHKVVGKKARVEFLNGKKIVGYLGSDFKDEDGDDCLSLFEAYEEKKGFYDYHFYKLKDVLKMDVLCYPRENIDFKFVIKIRDIQKYIKGVTEKKKK